MRRPVNFLLHSLMILTTLLSFPLLVACLIFWPRSYVHADSFWFNRHNHARALITNAGHVKLYFQRVNADAPFSIVANTGHRAQTPDDPRPSMRNPGLDTSLYFAGFAYAAGSTAVGHNRVILLPFWFLTLLFATPFALLLQTLRRRRRRYRKQHNLCPRCAYDLRATPGQCPECGYVLPATHANGPL